MKKIVSVMVSAALLAAAGPVFAQGQVEAAAAATRGQVIDLAGTWANRLHEDWVERAPGPHIGDYTGLPINDEARAYADLYQVSMQNMPERQCILYTSQYIVMGPQNLRIEPEVDPISGAIVAATAGLLPRRPNGPVRSSIAAASASICAVQDANISSRPSNDALSRRPIRSSRSSSA